MFKSKQPLKVEQLAKLFIQLAQLEAAGLPIFQAVEILIASDAELKKPLALMLQYLKAGWPMADAGCQAGIFNDTHKTLIHAAEASGQLGEICRQLARHYTRLDLRIKKIKSRLYMPILTLILSLFVQPLPAVVSAEISVLEYLKLSLGALFLISMSLFLLLRLPLIVYSLGIEKAWHRLQLLTPAVADWISRRQINEFLFILALMLESGLAFADALPKAVVGIDNSCLRGKFTPALLASSSGASVTEILSKVPVITSTILQIINSSEQSGKLASGILQLSRREAGNIDLQDEALAEWLPRLAYCLIAIWMAYAFLGSHFTAAVPINI
jgi:type II secretory pathway component PulF